MWDLKSYLIQKKAEKEEQMIIILKARGET